MIATLPKIPFVVDSRLVKNHLSSDVYAKSGISLEDKYSVFSHQLSKATQLQLTSVLKSRFCLVKRYGLCSKKGGKVLGYTLKVSGKSFVVKCDCKNCFMYLVAEE